MRSAETALFRVGHSYSLEFNNPVSQLFSFSGEQPKQRILAYKQNSQLPVVQRYFTNIAA